MNGFPCMGPDGWTFPCIFCCVLPRYTVIVNVRVRFQPRQMCLASGVPDSVRTGHLIVA
jgi:hypothetical protein